MICKHSTSHIAVEQSCNAGPVFRSTNAMSESVTKEESTHMGFKWIIVNVFSKLINRGILIFSRIKNGALVDLLSYFPEIISKAGTNDAYQTGFINNGMCNVVTYIYPNLNYILNACNAIFCKTNGKFYDKELQ